MHQTVPVTFSHVGLLDHYRIQYSSFPRVISVRCIFIMDALIFVITIRIESFCYLYYHDLYLYVLCQKRLYLPIRASIPCCILLGRSLFFLNLNVLMLMMLLIMMASCSPQMAVAHVASSLPLVLAGRLLSGISLTNADLSIEQRK